MASLKDLRNRISSVKSTQKITKAMQMVAAAKLRRAQEQAEAARPFSQRMASVMANIASAVDGDDAPRLMAGTGSEDVHLLVVCTAERGLCGGFNSSIAKKAAVFARDRISEGKTIKILPVGKKGADILRREFGDAMLPRIDFREVKRIGFGEAQEVADRVTSMFQDGEFDVCTLFYAEFESVISQKPTEQRIVPAAPEEEVEATDSIYEYEPDPGSILTDLVPRNIAVQIFRALLENGASEQGARMSAMDNATRNAGEMIDRLSLSYNRQRQAQITTELIEIIAGAEAL